MQDTPHPENQQTPRADRVLSLRELAHNVDSLDYMGAAVTYTDLVNTEGYAGNHSYHYNLLTASNECKWIDLWKYDRRV